MKCVELIKKGQFELSKKTRLTELRQLQTCEDFSEYCLYQTKNVKMGLILLEPYERTPFRLIKNNFKLICLSGGDAITRFSHGGISLLMFERGEYVSYNVHKKTMINDLQNIGNNLLVMALIEYKDMLLKDGGFPSSLQVETPIFSGY